MQAQRFGDPQEQSGCRALVGTTALPEQKGKQKNLNTFRS